MINVENEIFTIISTVLRDKYEGIYVTGEYLNIPPTFPAVSIEEVNNTIRDDTRDSSFEEKYSRIVYDINVYSNKKTGKKTEAKEIANTIDKQLIKMGFSRPFFQSIPSEDKTIYRFTGRYTATISNDKKIYK